MSADTPGRRPDSDDPEGAPAVAAASTPQLPVPGGKKEKLPPVPQPDNWHPGEVGTGTENWHPGDTGTGTENWHPGDTGTGIATASGVGTENWHPGDTGTGTENWHPGDAGESKP